MLYRVLLFLLLIAPSSSSANDGVFKDKIIFGQSAVLKGPASALGQGMRMGIRAAFKEVNDKGGVQGRTLELISYNDGYEPTHAIKNIQKLINTDKVFAIIGGVGTPTANAVLPIITKEQIPFIAPFTGAQILREPFNKYVINVRASYAQEIEEWIERLTTDLNIKKIAVFYQEDMFGLAGLAGIEKAIKKRNLKLVAKGTFRRNTLAVKRAVITINETHPEAILMIGTYKPCAKFISLSKKLGSKARFLNLSFVGSKALAEALGPEGEGAIISQVVPSPFNNNSPLVKAYQTALKKLGAKTQYDFVSLEGYIAGRLAIDILRKTEGKVTRDSFLNTLYAQEVFSFNGMSLSYKDKNNQGSNSVFLTILDKNGNFTPRKTLGRSLKQ